MQVARLARGAVRCRARGTRATFFNRNRERVQLREGLQTAPAKVLVLLGPRSCGKTRLLEEVLREHYQMQPSEHKKPPLWLDGRKGELDSTESMYNAVGKSLDNAQGWLRSMLSTALKIVSEVRPQVSSSGVSFGMLLRDSDVRTKIDLFAQLIDAFQAVREPGGPTPVLCLDEANRMTRWTTANEQDDTRRRIMDFFVEATKVDKKAHVILSTSEYSYVNWISKEIPPDFLKIEVLGDFAKDDARVFFETNALDGAPVTDEDWQRVYEVCGGNAGQLLAVGTEYQLLKNWEQAFLSVSYPISLLLEAALEGQMQQDGNPAVSFTGEDFEVVVRMLLDAHHNVVDWNSLALAVGHSQGAVDEKKAPRQGKKALNAMVAANVLAKRSKSVLSFDIPDEAFVDGEPLACAMTPVHLYVLRKMQNKKRF